MHVCRYKNATLIKKGPEFPRFKPQEHHLEIRDVREEDAGDYTLVMKNTAAGIEKKIHFILIVNGNSVSFFTIQ